MYTIWLVIVRKNYSITNRHSLSNVHWWTLVKTKAVFSSVRTLEVELIKLCLTCFVSCLQTSLDRLIMSEIGTISLAIPTSSFFICRVFQTSSDRKTHFHSISCPLKCLVVYETAITNVISNFTHCALFHRD